MASNSMPIVAGPHEPLREGLATHKDHCHISHPVEKIMENSSSNARAGLQENVYGSALAARAAIEQQVLNRYAFYIHTWFDLDVGNICHCRFYAELKDFLDFLLQNWDSSR